MPSAPHTPRRFRLAWTLAVAYLLTVAYASGQPFRGWRIPSEETLHFLTAPWPRYVTLSDLLLNIGAYVPLGFLLTVALRPRLRSRGAVAAGLLLGLATSIAMEYMQTMLPNRIASNVDVLTNGIGTLLGALAAPLFAPTRELGRRLTALRYRWFRPGVAADAGVVLVCLWVLTALHPTAQLLGTGDVRATLDLQSPLLHTPGLAVATEAAVVALNLAGVGLLVSQLVYRRSDVARVLVVAMAIAVSIKAATAAAMKTAPAWSWMTPGVLLGFLAGAVALYAAARLPESTRAWGAATAIAAAVVVINVAPGNPYQTVPPQLLVAASQFLGYKGIIRAQTQVWP
jgi:VanZ family protein